MSCELMVSWVSFVIFGFGAWYFVFVPQPEHPEPQPGEVNSL